LAWTLVLWILTSFCVTYWFREEDKTDLTAANDENAVLIMDYSQNLTVPSVSSTPSQWYFLSLRSVNLFGGYFANKGIQYSYVYDETVAGKGSDEVNSMLHHFIRRIVIPGGYRKLTIYADNCGGQNKNSYVVRMLLALTHMEEIDAIDLKFLSRVIPRTRWIVASGTYGSTSLAWISGRWTS
jgi:hypothetical protein